MQPKESRLKIFIQKYENIFLFLIDFFPFSLYNINVVSYGKHEFFARGKAMRREYYSETSHQLLFSLYDALKRQRNNRLRKHVHTELEIGYIVEGSGKYTLEEETFTVGPGDIILVRTNEQHCVTFISTGELLSFNIHMTPYYLWSICSEYIDSGTIQSLVSSSVKINHFFPKETGFGSEIEEIRRLFSEGSEENRFVIKRKMLEFIIKISKEIGGEHSFGGDVSRAVARMDDIQGALEYIRDNISCDITLNDIARAASMSRSYLSGIFKLVTGVTPYDYLIIARIEKSLEMLRETELPVLVISQKCGFGSLASFNKAFKKNMGMTPSYYRTSHKM